MWHTPNGIRALSGPEEILIREAIASLVDLIDQLVYIEEDEDATGIRLFDELHWRQKLTMIVEVGEALFDPVSPPPKLTAINEATIAAIYETIDRNIVIEIDNMKDDPENESWLFWRRLLLACLHDGEPLPADEKLPLASCDERWEWEWILAAVADRLLWDDDYLGFPGLMDGSPEQAMEIREHYGITDDYFTVIAPDPLESAMEGIRESLKRLTASCQG